MRDSRISRQCNVYTMLGPKHNTVPANAVRKYRGLARTKAVRAGQMREREETLDVSYRLIWAWPTTDGPVLVSCPTGTLNDTAQSRFQVVSQTSSPSSSLASTKTPEMVALVGVADRPRKKTTSRCTFKIKACYYYYSNNNNTLKRQHTFCNNHSTFDILH